KDAVRQPQPNVAGAGKGHDHAAQAMMVRNQKSETRGQKAEALTSDPLTADLWPLSSGRRPGRRPRAGDHAPQGRQGKIPACWRLRNTPVSLPDRAAHRRRHPCHSKPFAAQSLFVPEASGRSSKHQSHPQKAKEHHKVTEGLQMVPRSSGWRRLPQRFRPHATVFCPRSGGPRFTRIAGHKNRSTSSLTSAAKTSRLAARKRSVKGRADEPIMEERRGVGQQKNGEA